jgi:integrase
MAAHVGGRLTVARVRSVGPGKYADGANLWLKVAPTGSKSWFLRYALGGRTREMGLGSYPLVSLSEARDKATALRRLLADGVDPIAAREVQEPTRKAITFGDAAERYIAGHERGWSQAHARQWRNSIKRYVTPAIGHRGVADVDTHDVLTIVEPLWLEKTETATRVLDRIRLVLDWAAARKLRTGENPARWSGHLDAVLPRRARVQPVENHAALPYPHLPQFMAALRQQRELGARAAELMILTATRTGEARFATWPEIDLDARMWVIPAERMKATREHRVPLSAPALALLRQLFEARSADRVFPDMGQHAILKAIKRVDPTVTAHGFRSSFADWCAEQTDFPSEVREMALAHAVGDKVEAAYRRGDLFEKRRQLAEAWAAYCGGVEAAPNEVRLVTVF